MENLCNRSMRINQIYPVTATLSQSDDFTPAFQQFAQGNFLDYDSLQFVVGHPVDSNTHASNAIITKNEVCLSNTIDLKSI